MLSQYSRIDDAPVRVSQYSVTLSSSLLVERSLRPDRRGRTRPRSSRRSTLQRPVGESTSPYPIVCGPSGRGSRSRRNPYVSCGRRGRRVTVRSAAVRLAEPPVRRRQRRDEMQSKQPLGLVERDARGHAGAPVAPGGDEPVVAQPRHQLDPRACAIWCTPQPGGRKLAAEAVARQRRHDQGGTPRSAGRRTQPGQ